MNLPEQLSPWIMRLNPAVSAPRSLFLFPFAGGGANVFRSWIDHLPERMEIFAIQLPGRGSRLREYPFRRITPLISSLITELTPYLEKPYVFFGHSMGALVAFELARRLQQKGIGPAQLHVSAYPAPHVPFPYHHLHDLSENDFIREMRILSGTPPEVFECRELLELIIPTLRADFEVLDTYKYHDADPLSCPIYATGGTQDVIAGEVHLAAWQDLTSDNFSLHMFDGNHFFFEQYKREFFATFAMNLGLT